MIDLLALLAAGGLAGFLMDSLRARERALAHCRRACRELDVQLLDETVAVSRLAAARDGRGRWRLRRTYRFEFSASGADRRPGVAVLTGPELSHLRLEHPDGPLVLPAPGPPGGTGRPRAAPDRARGRH